MKKSPMLLFALAAILAMVSPARADNILYDHFDDGVIAPWTVDFVNALGADYVEEFSELSVTNIVVDDPNTNWSYVNFSLILAPQLDFSIHAIFSWSSVPIPDGYVSAQSVKKVKLRCYDENENQLASVGFADYYSTEESNNPFREAWTPGEGKQEVIGGANPYNGVATVDIERIGGIITVKWDGNLMATGTSSAPLNKILLEFGYDWIQQGGPPSYFGTGAFDLVQVGDAPIIPEPATLALLAAGALGLLGYGWRRKRR